MLPSADAKRLFDIYLIRMRLWIAGIAIAASMLTASS
jgi:hypothetical protein